MIFNFLRNIFGMNHHINIDPQVQEVNRMVANNALTGMPFFFDSPIKKEIPKEVFGHVYFDLSPRNIPVAIEELSKLDDLIAQMRRTLPLIPSWAKTRIEEIDFSYSKVFVCTPELAKVLKTSVLRLSFLTHSVHTHPDNGYEASGTIKYKNGGEVSSAQLSVTKSKTVRDHFTYEMWLFNFRTIQHNLIISKIEKISNGEKVVVYKRQSQNS